VGNRSVPRRLITVEMCGESLGERLRDVGLRVEAKRARISQGGYLSGHVDAAILEPEHHVVPKLVRHDRGRVGRSAWVPAALDELSTAIPDPAWSIVGTVVQRDPGSGRIRRHGSPCPNGRLARPPCCQQVVRQDVDDSTGNFGIQPREAVELRDQRRNRTRGRAAQPEGGFGMAPVRPPLEVADTADWCSVVRWLVWRLDIPAPTSRALPHPLAARSTGGGLSRLPISLPGLAL